MVNKLFTKKGVFLVIVFRMDMKLNKSLKIGYFCTKSNIYIYKGESIGANMRSMLNTISGLSILRKLCVQGIPRRAPSIKSII